MRIDRTEFGEITIDGKTYEHDVIIRLSGEVVKRKKKLSKRLYGTSHIVSKDEAKFVFEKGGANGSFSGSGREGNVHLSPEAEAYFAKKDCKVVIQRSTWKEDWPIPRDCDVLNPLTAWSRPHMALRSS